MMTRVDAVNGCFALGAAFFNYLNVRAILRDKSIKGVHWSPTLFFATLGVWNLFAYPALHLWFSFVCEWGVVAMNFSWLGLAFWYWINSPLPFDEEPNGTVCETDC